MPTPGIAIPEGGALLTPRQTGAYLQVSATTLRKLAADGALKPVRIGKALRYHRAAIEAFVKALLAAAGA
jgi:excisionase family DNA binding protein